MISKKKNNGKLKVLIVFVILLFVTIIIAIMGLLYFYGPNFNIYLFPPSPKKYGEIALEKMEQIGFYANSDEWILIKNETQIKLKNAKNYEETIPLLENAIQVAGGKHSFIITKADLNQSNNSELILPTVECWENILILKAPSFSGDIEAAQQYVNILADSFQNYTYESIILDLRGNTGGDMGPMIAGLSPILQDGEILSFVDRYDNITPLVLENGTLKNIGVEVSPNNQNKISNVPIAILIDGMTGSSGEITALAFKGMPNVTYIGSNTAGYTSANHQIVLYDGSIMQITGEIVKDRDGIVYNNISIIPDIKTDDPMLEAKNFLKNEIR